MAIMAYPISSKYSDFAHCARTKTMRTPRCCQSTVASPVEPVAAAVERVARLSPVFLFAPMSDWSQIFSAGGANGYPDKIFCGLVKFGHSPKTM